MSEITLVTMPKWGLSMEQGKVNCWLKQVGDAIKRGEEIVEVESEKIAGAVEAAADGIMRRQLAAAEDTLPVGGLLGVIAAADVPDAEIDAAVADALANFKPLTADDESSGASPEKIQVGNRSIRYLKRGEGGTPVILIHGFGGDLNNWLFNHEALANSRTVYAVDLPGHGESTKDVGSGALSELADALLCFMDAVGVDKANLVGHSMGAGVAMAAAVQAPARVESLTLICGAGLGAEINGDYIQGFVGAANRNAIKPQLMKLFGDASLVTRQLVEDIMKYKRIEGVDAALRTLSSALFADGRQQSVLRDQVAALGKPVLIIWGEADQIIPVAHARAYTGKAQVEVIAGKGHMVQMEAANEVNQLIKQFLS
ncbi:MAG TPA: acetoin dehydrogenase dihydrolipoyllysine-residue acetyltransferase subunit [Rhodocyclaceae bacterium]|nr:acetoin dehydrogenase dihydrolipoyllysine-residue acetyltransferase subunit [Rhodocyclaceae bacterium]HMV53455.1 acetoin dehydrogenase dihydrolipoyllysine-residue acetyltransferase subunit [Rhodocyclaceae bacterium]HMZ83763.1 acetoin dehydrogenase dihydrolipoyllysine-residue acetyltransferase subunit [Rhodocyclaceae bacterium]HNA03864.1 acetoin dehydrogenase dihydrolipoyllysine-residue acetyltransferase subunit [Rhodocyclaceae bacterium]HNB79491.1 acetoin dehydrogenase dihydrolipoyllysine-re